MNRKAIFIPFVLLIVLIIGGYKYISSKNSAVSGLKVLSTPSSSIYLNDKLIGKTPLETQNKSGEYILKLIPDDPTSQVSAWQGKIILNPSVLTYVKKDLGTSELKTAGEILTLEKISQNSAEVVITTAPSGAKVILDGQEKGMSPLTLKDVVIGEHDVGVNATGFIDRSVRIQATGGYRLNVDFQLALAASEEATSAGTNTASPIPKGTETESKGPTKPYAVIKDTPTGFLRVRSGPNLSASETAQVKPGEKYPIIDDKDGWYKISFDSGKQGWVSGAYAEKVQ